MPCMGNGEDHCCYLRGVPCRFLITDHVDETGHFRKWACGLRAELGNWDAVIASDRYQQYVAPTWAKMNPPLNCRDWPDGEGVNKGTCTRPECQLDPPKKVDDGNS